MHHHLNHANASMAALVLQDVQLPPNAETIEAFFQQQVDILQQSLDSFDARLAWYVPKAVLPAAAIGDPAKDFKSSGRFGDGHCGTFRPGNEFASCCMMGGACMRWQLPSSSLV
jgi:hypothetical protein